MRPSDPHHNPSHRPGKWVHPEYTYISQPTQQHRHGRSLCSEDTWRKEFAIAMELGYKLKQSNGAPLSCRYKGSIISKAKDLLGTDLFVHEALEEIQELADAHFPRRKHLISRYWLPRDGAGAASMFLQTICHEALEETHRFSFGKLPPILERATGGGRLEVFRTRGDYPLKENDLIGAYASIFAHYKAPTGCPLDLTTTHPPMPIEVWDCTVKAGPRAHSQVGPLPVRMPHAIYYPVGTSFRGSWWRAEIEGALEAGWEVTQLHRRWGFSTSSIWQEVFSKLCQIRAEAEYSEKFWKLLAIKIVGHLGSSAGSRVWHDSSDWTPTPVGAHSCVTTGRVGIMNEKTPAPWYSRRQIASWCWSMVRRKMYDALISLEELPALCFVDAIWSHEKVDLPEWREKDNMPAPWYIPYPGARQSQGEWLALPGQSNPHNEIAVSITNRRYQPESEVTAPIILRGTQT